MDNRTCAVCSCSSGRLKYCSSKCKSKSSNRKRYKRPARKCPGCALDLTDRHGQVKYCSNTCRRWVANGHSELRIPAGSCAVCGASMAQKKVSAVYCTRQCKAVASEARRVRDDHERYLKERTRRIAYASEYLQRNPHVAQAARRKRKSLLAKSGVFEVTGSQWLRELRRHAGKCAYCGKPGTTMDHVIPVSRGGTHSVGNLVPACGSCNSSKHHRTVMEWRLSRRVPLAS